MENNEKFQHPQDKPYFGEIYRSWQGLPSRHVYMLAMMEFLCKSKNTQPVNILEIGSWAGGSALTWAEGIKTYNNNNGKITCVDTWKAYVKPKEYADQWNVFHEMQKGYEKDAIYKLFLHNIKSSGFKKMVIPLRGQSNHILPTLESENFDLLFIDGAHDYESVLNDINNSLRLVKDGGIICGDDLELTSKQCDLDIAKSNAHLEHAVDPKTNLLFHPGITLAVSETFGEVSHWQGFWAMQKSGENWKRIRLQENNLRIPQHLYDAIQAGKVNKSSLENIPINNPVEYDPPKLIEPDYHGFNLILYKDRYYAMSIKLGPVDIFSIEDTKLKEYQDSAHCFIADNLVEVKNKVDQSFVKVFNTANIKTGDENIQVIFDNPNIANPKVSLVLLDWSCRESFHILDYLDKQSVPRQMYEVIWIEYYDRQAKEISQRLNDCKAMGKPPQIDKWIVMNMPKDVYYHKHLMYNTGIITSKGEIVTICDSDAVVSPTLIESIVKSFEKEPNIVLHMDEVRNIDKKYYPFNYPSIKEISGKGCINFSHGKTTGLRSSKDTIHTRNYGACMSALKADLIKVGGADEHIDYLGHICGPYDLTFRLINAGIKEVWHDKEFFYHTWHPGSDGLQNYLGPHDGKNVSLKALEARDSKRVMPWLENTAIKALRMNPSENTQTFFNLLIDKDLIEQWRIDENKLEISYGRVHYHRREFDDTIKHWRKVSGSLYHDENFLSEFGWAYYHLDQYDKALGLFKKALSINENNTSSLTGIGWINITRRNFIEAEILLGKAVNAKIHTEPDLLAIAKQGYKIASRHKKWDNFEMSYIGRIYISLVQKFYYIGFLFKKLREKVSCRIRERNFHLPKTIKYKIWYSDIRNNLFKKHDSMRNVCATNYPCDVPTYKVEQNLDFLLLELPPRYMPMMPNGLGHVHNILKNCNINSQTIDMNIISYHKYHHRRITQNLTSIITESGYSMPHDPWDNTNMCQWEKPEFIEYFMPEIEVFISEIVEANPKAIGISLSGNNRSIVKEFVKKLRCQLPQVVIVVGGYDCVYYGLGQHLFKDFDYMVIGEAELTLAALAKAISKDQKPKDLPGIVSKYDSPNRIWQPTPLIQDLDSIDFPKYEWANHIWYQSFDRKHLIPITGTRGCNWGKCRFCGECFQFRKRTPAKVADEIEYYTKLGFHTFHFNESDVNGDPQNLYDICSEIINRKLKVLLVGQLRIDRRNTSDYFKHLAKAGFVHLRFGVDGWTDTLLKLQNKGYNMTIANDNLKNCHTAKIRVTVNMVIGVPGESQADVDQAIKNVIKCKKYISVIESFNTLLLVKGSEYYENPEKYNIEFRGNKDDIYKKHIHFIPSELWYSNKPYIDQNVRMERLEKIISVLHKNGVDVGGFASKVVENLRDDQNKSKIQKI